MSQPQIRLKGYAPGYASVLIVEVDCSDPLDVRLEVLALNLLKNFVGRPPERGFVTIRWERGKISPEISGESN